MQFKNWNFSRILRLVLGVAIIVQAYYAKDVFMGFMGVLFTAMPVFNVGCCATGNCSTPTVRKTEDKEITYEEVS